MLLMTSGLIKFATRTSIVAFAFSNTLWRSPIEVLCWSDASSDFSIPARYSQSVSEKISIFWGLKCEQNRYLL